MPIYQLVTAGVDLDQSQRDRLAQGILEIHHSETHAPEPFVRLALMPAPLGAMYTAGKVAPSVVLNCGIRSGRPAEKVQSIVRRCYDLIREVVDVQPDQIVITVDQRESWSSMEAGFFMPEATHDAEAAWIAALQQAYPGQYDQWGADGRRPGHPDGDASPALSGASSGGDTSS